MRRVLTLLGVVAVVTTVATPAIGHGASSSSPEPGSTVGGRVDEIQIGFPEVMVSDTMSIEVSGPDGSVVAVTSPPRLIGGDRVVAIGVEPLLAAGAYRVDYSLTGVDGVREPSAFVFTYAPGGSEPTLLITSSGVNLSLIGAILVGLVVLFALVSRTVMSRSPEGG